MNQLHLVDLDRTLFNTKQFLADLLTIMETEHAVNPDTFREEITRYRQGEYYDFYGQVKAMTGLSQVKFDALIGDRLAGRSYLYADVAPWLAARAAANEAVVIITVGQEPFQQLKLRHAHGLDSLSRTIVPTNKGAIIARQLRPVGESGYQLDLVPGVYDSFVLIDDNPATFHQLGIVAAIRTYHLARPGETYTSEPTPAGTIRITSLADVVANK